MDLSETLDGNVIERTKQLIKKQWEKSGNYVNIRPIKILCKLYWKPVFVRIIYSTLMPSNQWKEQNVSLLLHLKFANEIHVISAYEGFIYDSQMIVPISVSKQCGINCLYGLMMYSEFMN